MVGNFSYLLSQAMNITVKMMILALFEVRLMHKVLGNCNRKTLSCCEHQVRPVMISEQEHS